MKKIILSFFFFICAVFISNAQYYKEHYIAPAPWQYWSTANEIVIGTLSASPVSVELKKSDETPLATLTVSSGNPVSYRFEGDAFAINANQANQNYTDRGLIIEAEEPVLINMRNIASDFEQGWNSLGVSTIKGNASLVSFGKEGMGLEFRLGYYRQSTMGLYNNNPVYSVMATEDETVVTLPTTPTETEITLQKGMSRLFYAPIGSLLVADKPVVVNVGSWGDTPQTCGINGQDGTFDQVAPVNVLGTQYLVVRGDGTAPTVSQETLFYGSEQSLIVASEDNTEITIQHYSATGVALGVPVNYTLEEAGDFYSFYHGDGQNQYSSSLIESNKPVVVYAGTAVACETDISTVLPIGGCAGTTNIQTRKFINYNNGNLPYFGFTIIESETEPVMLGGSNLETVTGNNRIALGDTGFYMLRFNNTQLNNPENLILSSDMPLTTSLVQQGDGFSMSAFFSAFGQAAISPIIVSANENCTVTIEAQNDPDITEYEWFLEGESIGVTDENTIDITESGNYTVKVLKNCGWGNASLPTAVEVNPCSDLSIKKEVKSQQDNIAIFKITVKNNDEIFTDKNVIMRDILPSGYSFISYTATQGEYNSESGEWNIGELEPLSEASIEIEVIINEEGEFMNRASVEGENIDKNLQNNEDEAIINFGKIYLTKQAEKKEYYKVGDIIKYTLEVKNTGDQILKNVRIIDVNADKGSIKPALIPEIKIEQSVIVTAEHTITVDDFVNGEVINQAVAIAETSIGDIEQLSDDPVTEDLNDPTIVRMIRTADLVTLKDDGLIYYRPGQETNYSIIVSNAGPSSAVNVVVEDPFPEGVTSMTWTSSIGTNGEGALYDIIPLIQEGENVKYNVKLTIPQKQKGDFVNTVYVSSDYNEDPSPDCETCTDINRQELIIPKGISPNGDGLNDFFDLENYHVKKLHIFNRFGVCVYEANNYVKEWFGQRNDNTLVPSGTYFYVIITDINDEFTGWVQVQY